MACIHTEGKTDSEICEEVAALEIVPELLCSLHTVGLALQSAWKLLQAAQQSGGPVFAGRYTVEEAKEMLGEIEEALKETPISVDAYGCSGGLETVQ